MADEVLSYYDDEPFPGHVGLTFDESVPAWPRAAPRARGCAQRRARRARRRRLRPDRLLRVQHRHAPPRRARGRRSALPQLPHHRDVLADPGLPAHGAQPPHLRDRRHHRPRARVPRLPRPHPPLVRLRARGAAPAGLGHVRGRQVAPHAVRRDAHRGTARPLAARAGLRALLRLHRRRDQPVLPRAGDRQHADPLRGARRLPPHRRPRRPVDRRGQRPARHRRREALLPLPRAGCVPRAAPGAARVDRPLRRAVRRRVGGVPRAHPRAPARRGDHPARNRPRRRVRRGSPRGTRWTTTSAAPRRG